MKFNKDAEYTPLMMHQVLSHTATPSTQIFYTRGMAERPLFYETAHAIIFPPCTDKEGENQREESIRDVLAAAAPALIPSAFLHDKIFLFPIAQMQSTIPFIDSPRKHWVTLHYNPSTQTATLIDSRPRWASLLYRTLPMMDQLRTGLIEGAYPCRLEKTNPAIYQGIQDDFTHCGAWTAVNIEAYAHGVSLEAHRGALSREDRDPVLQHNADCAAGEKTRQYHRFNISEDEDREFIVVGSPAQRRPHAASMSSSRSGDTDIETTGSSTPDRMERASRTAATTFGDDEDWEELGSPTAAPSPQDDEDWEELESQAVPSCAQDDEDWTPVDPEEDQDATRIRPK